MTYEQHSTQRYKNVGRTKSGGAIYTPRPLADFVAQRIVATVAPVQKRVTRVLDPAVGQGELLLALLERLEGPVEVFGFETDPRALAEARDRLSRAYPDAVLNLRLASFLDHVSHDFGADFADGPFSRPAPYDLIIANPPYVRAQTLGAVRVRQLAKQFGLTGRVDLYQVFLRGIATVLAPDGVAGLIVPNRFMITKDGASTRAGLVNDLRVREVYDLGDTKLFSASVLPAAVIARGTGAEPVIPSFTSIYTTSADPTGIASDPLAALRQSGTMALPDSRTFHVQHGTLHQSIDPAGIWRLTSDHIERWLETVRQHSWGSFGDIGKVRVGIKTSADKVFLPKTWDRDLELHRTLTTHHAARRFRPASSHRRVLYPHHCVDGRTVAVDLAQFPASRAYLEAHRQVLEARSYVTDAGRHWYEIWVPQKPEGWRAPKLVLRDISEQPTFWMDLEGTVVNGDCYWLTGDEDLLWLALGVANSTFIERFYDLCFNNRLYSGKRRFMTQYVAQFPLPDPDSEIAREIITSCRALYARLADGPSPELKKQIDQMVWAAFGLAVGEG